jgi:NADH-quinone oxidoreductase subunit L
VSPALLLALPGLPALSALVITLWGNRLSYNAVGALATVSVGLSFLIALGFLPSGVLGTGEAVALDLGAWLATEGFRAGMDLRLDSPGLTMTLMVTFFGTLITGYSVGYMRPDVEQSRFFASLNLFVSAMLVLVLADNLVLIFLGWEGVGLCSYLLVGHYWREKNVPLAAYRAFFVNRVGDLFFLLGVFTLYAAFGTVSLSALSENGPALLEGREGLAGLGALLVLGGAFAKSAQAPFHVWLPDAMAGPTPVSALIHAATMVTAGVYLIMQLDWLYAAFPEVRMIIGLCALVTLVVGAFMAVSQYDIKKILAYSTVANLGMMFLALAAGSTHAALLHLFGHAFFKALLFLGAGSVIFSSHHEQDARKLGGVLKTMPVTRAALWIGCIGGAGFIPYFSAAFFTKEAVLESIRGATLAGFGWEISGAVVYWIVLAVESLAALYFFRLLGYLSAPAGAHHAGHEVPREGSPAIRAVLVALSVAAVGFALFSSTAVLTAWVSAGAGAHEAMHWGHVLPVLAVNISLATACFLVFSVPARRERVLSALSHLRLGNKGPLTHTFYFDELYEYALTRPLQHLSSFFKTVLESVFTGILLVTGRAGTVLSLWVRRLQSGRAHHYAALGLLFLALTAWIMLWGME